MTDIELFENHRRGSDQAFADLVQRHLGWIYGVARRGLGDSHRAEDIAQTVFVLLHRKAPRFAADAAMICWLHTATCYATKTIAREERRRKRREIEFATQRPGSTDNASASDPNAADWQTLAPVLDEMVCQLSRVDREAILLRYYRDLTFVELGAEIGTTEEAARKRVDRALQKLRRLATRKGLTCGATLPLYLASQIQTTPPAGLIATSTVAATAQPGSALTASSNLMLKGVFAMAVTKSTLVVAGIVAAAVLLAALALAGIWSSAPHKHNLPPIAAATMPATRASAATQPVASLGPISIDSSLFDCGTPFEAQQDSTNHVTLHLKGFQLDWWMFHLTGVAGKTITIDIVLNANQIPLNNWKPLNPVYSYVTDLNDPAAYVTGSVDVNVQENQRVPETDEQKWHYVTDCQLTGDHDFKMTQHFTSDSVYIAGRVPYTPGYAAKFVDSLVGNPHAKVIDLGTTPEHRPIRVVQIGPTDDASQKSKPCVLICGGEQAYQPDGMWACQGAIEFLIGDSENAKHLRAQYVFLIIPMLDPDVTAHTNYNFIDSFSPQKACPTSILYANWLQNRVIFGGRIDLVIDLHSLQARECQHVQHVNITPALPEQAAYLAALQDQIVQQCDANNLLFSPKAQNGGPHSPIRFPGWIDEHFGALDTVYEVNAQARLRHLTLSQLKETGCVFVQASVDFLASREGKLMMASVDKDRVVRKAAWDGNPATQPARNAIESEATIEGKTLEGFTAETHGARRRAD